MTSLVDFLPAQKHRFWVPIVLIAVLATACNPAKRSVLEVTVGPELAECVGVGPMQCLVVDEELFYDSIEGFEYVEGYVYRIRMERYDAWPDLDEPPQDVSGYGYRLVDIISQTPVE